MPRTPSQTVQTSQELLLRFVRFLPGSVAMFDRNMRYLQASDRWCSDFGLELSKILNRSYYEVFPNLPPHWKDVHQRGLTGETIRTEEDYFERHGGAGKWLRWETLPWGDDHGEPEGILIFSEDITAHKQAEVKNRDLTFALLSAEEEAARQIARELHDDIIQKLAVLSMQVGKIAATLPMNDAVSDLHGVQHKILAISEDIRKISHQMHPAILYDLGLSAALESMCIDLEDLQGIKVSFNAANVPEPVEPTIALCLYRVLQESLRNIVKHSSTKNIRVSLSGRPEDLVLVVMDFGIGFDLSATKLGLGIHSMRERVASLHGSLTVDSIPGRGTTVTARVPLIDLNRE